MKHYSDYGVIEIPDGTCYWEPCGNNHYAPTCGGLFHVKDFDSRNMTHCPYCKKPMYYSKEAPK